MFIDDQKKITIENPLFLWQFLRRNEFYRHAVNSYKVSMVPEEIELFDALKDKESMRKLIMGSDYYENELEGEPSVESLNDMGVANIFGGIEFLVGYVDFKSTSYKSFHQAFGEVLTFPIDYTVDAPCVWTLRSVWQLVPAKIILPKNELDAKIITTAILNNENNKHSVTVTFDFRFSEKQITDAVKKIFDVFKSKHTLPDGTVNQFIDLDDVIKDFNVSGIDGIGTLDDDKFELLSGKAMTYDEYLLRLKYYDHWKCGETREEAYKNSGLKIKANVDNRKNSLKKIEANIDSLIAVVRT